MGTRLKGSDLVYDAVIPFRRKTTNASLSGVVDTINCQEVWFIAQKGLVGASTTAYKMTFKEGDTDTSAAGLTAFASATMAAGLSTAAITNLHGWQCGNGNRKRYIGVILSTTAGTSRAVGILGFKVKNQQYPAASTGFTTVTHG